MMIEVPAVEDLRDISLSAGGLGAAPSLQAPSSEALPQDSLPQPGQLQAAESPAPLQQREDLREEHRQRREQPQAPSQQQHQEQPQTAEPQVVYEQPPAAAPAKVAQAEPVDATASAGGDQAAAAEPSAAEGSAAVQPAAEEGVAASDGAAPAQGSAAADGGAAAEGGAGEGAAGAASEAVEEEDELAANLLSNMSAWQSELDAFQAALRRCMETPATPAVPPPSSPALAESGSGGSRLQHNGPKGITGFRGVTQHKWARAAGGGGCWGSCHAAATGGA